ncbi:MAG: HAMP domain-containing sensor histidine kinase [Bacteroidales bacterium]
MKTFFKDISGFVALYVVNFVALLLLFNLLSIDADLKIVFYFFFLSLFFLFVWIVFRYIRNKSLYSNSLQTRRGDDIFGKGALASAVDELLRSRDEENCARLNESIKQQEEYKLFITRWVHAVKTNISVLGMVADEIKDPDTAGVVKAETDKILYNVNMALNFSRSSSPENDFVIRSVDLEEIMTECINNYKSWFIRKNIFPSLDVPQSVVVKSDSKWLGIIFSQLLTNAVKYSEPGSVVKTGVLVRGDEVEIYVSDNGIGIPVSEQKRVFELFYTGNNGRQYGESTGIGLFVVKKICDSLGYKITLESEPKKGTRVGIILKREI